jgi:hypothetical protein
MGADGSEGEDEDEIVEMGELSQLDMDLACIRQLLESKYGSDDQTGFSYICADGTPLALTPLRMREWSLAIVGLFLVPPERILICYSMTDRPQFMHP